MWMRPVAKMASARSMYWVWWIKRDKARWRWKEMLHGGVAGLLLAENSESAANGCTHADQVLQTADGESVNATEREAIASGGFLQLLRGDLACLE